MSESSRHALVIPIQVQPHGNADSLSIVQVDGFTVVVNTECWNGKTKACYIVPETIVDVRKPEFSFLKREDKNRDKEVVRVKKIRGVYSQGLLVPVNDDVPIGTDLWEALELEHYEPSEPDEKIIPGDCRRGPSHWINLPKYDIENWRKYRSAFQDGESINVMEKINGANLSCVYSEGEYHVKSRNYWKDTSQGDFAKAMNEDENILKFLRDNPDHLVQGELTGKVGGYKYGLKNGQIKIFVFDIRKPDYSYADVNEFYDITTKYNMYTPKTFGSSTTIEYYQDQIESFSDGLTLENDDHIREGVVIRPAVNRYEPKLQGRLILKCVSNTYLGKVKD
jgi:RNA ligase (TIGR02306 family)